MSDQFYEQISEFIDDEMSAEESEFFVRRLQRDESARHQYLRYQLIGAAVRGEYLHPGASDLGRRLEQEIKRDEAIVRQSRSRWARLVSTTGIAAIIAIVAIFALVALRPEPPASGAAGAAAVPGSSRTVADNSVVGSPLLVRSTDEVTGMQYLIHHARYSAGMFRTITQSNVISAQEADLADDVEESSLD